MDSSPPRATSVSFDDDMMWVELEDGRRLGVPLSWYPRLFNGSPELRNKAWITATGLHWDELDEDISIAGLIAGRRDQTKLGRQAA